MKRDAASWQNEVILMCRWEVEKCESTLTKQKARHQLTASRSLEIGFRSHNPSWLIAYTWTMALSSTMALDIWWQQCEICREVSRSFRTDWIPAPIAERSFRCWWRAAASRWENKIFGSRKGKAINLNYSNQGSSTHCGMVKFVDFLKCRCSVECNGGRILLAGLICSGTKQDNLHLKWSIIAKKRRISLSSPLFVPFEVIFMLQSSTENTFLHSFFYDFNKSPPRVGTSKEAKKNKELRNQ